MANSSLIAYSAAYAKGRELGAASAVDEIMDANRRDGLLFREILEKKAEELGA